MITNQQLREAFLNPRMKYYFDRKLASLPAAEIDARIEELLKYLNMAIFFEGYIPVSKEIDEAWHYWILETAEYESLCRKLQGRVFLHHSSADYVSYVDPDAVSGKLPIDLPIGIAILGSYVLNYGPFQPDRVKYWPLAAQLMERLGWDLDELNRRLLSSLPEASARRDRASASPFEGGTS
jgi:hypothetical protein